MAKKKRRKSKKAQRVLEDISTSQIRKEVSAQSEQIRLKEKHKKFSLLDEKFFLIIFILIIIGISSFLFFSLKVPVKKDSSLNVLLITLDTTRADRLGCYGYKKAQTPHIDSIASQGIIFSKAYAQVPLTFPSHCSLLTGTYPLYHGARNNGTYRLNSDLVTLAEILKDHGYQTAAFVSSFTVDSRFGLDQGFDIYDDDFHSGEAFKATNAERKAEQVFKSFASWLDKKEEKPFFCWVHFFDPHLPYEPPSPYKEKFASELYDGEIAYMDFYVGQVIEKLKEKNLLKRTLIVLAGDHGEAFGEKGEDGHGIFLYEETMRVPLIFFASHRLPTRRTVQTRARLIDIMPTILDILKIAVPKQVQGKSLLSTLKRFPSRDWPNYMESYFPKENYSWSELIGLIDGEWKYILAPKEELYNLKKDPNEKSNLAEQKRSVINNLRKKLNSHIQTYSSPFLASRIKPTLEETEKLKSLGYVAGAEEVPKGNLPDPKDKIEELKMSTMAEMLEFEQRYEEAANLYERLLDLNPRIASNYVNLALTYFRLNRPEQAVKVLEKGMEKMPHSILLLSRLAHTYLALGRLKKAFDLWQQVLAIDSEYFDALLSCGWILDLMGDKEGARKFYQQAMKIEPENKFLGKNLAFNLATSGYLQDAINIYENLVMRYADDYEIWQDLGIAYGYAGNIDRATYCLEKAIALKPTPTAYYNLAVAKKKKNEINEAIKYLKLYLENSAGENEERVRNARLELTYLEKSLKK